MSVEQPVEQLLSSLQYPSICANTKTDLIPMPLLIYTAQYLYRWNRQTIKWQMEQPSVL